MFIMRFFIWISSFVLFFIDFLNFVRVVLIVILKVFVLGMIFFIDGKK